MVPEPASRFRITLASLVVGKCDQDPEDAPELFEAIFSIDEKDGELICEFDVDATNLAVVEQRVNCDTQPLDNGRVFVVVGFGDMPIHEAVAALASAYKGTPMGDARYMFELLQADGTSSHIVLSVRDVGNNHSLFTISEVIDDGRPGTTKAQWNHFSQTAGASELVEQMLFDHRDAAVRLTEEATMYHFEAITRIVTLFPRGLR